MNPANAALPPIFQQGPCIRTLLVDDSESMRDYLRMLVALEGGFELVGTAPDGREGVQLASALKPQLILMDVRMPCLDGLEATRIIKQSGSQAGPQPVIIIVTSEDTVECRSEAKEAGADGFVAKSENLRIQLKSALHGLFSKTASPCSQTV
jgi:CheY-like chemotaxis protein